MARYPGKDAIYSAADQFRSRCLLNQKSLLWPAEPAWILGNLDRMIQAFVGKPDLSARPFLEKLHDQLEGQAPVIHRIASDVLAFYFLYPAKITAATKLASLREIVGWQIGGNPPALPEVEAAYQASGVGYPGTYYNTGRPWHVAFYLKFARALLADGLDAMDLEVCKQVADRIETGSEHKSHLGKQILLHLLFPDKVERIASLKQKQLVVKKFSKAGDPSDLDDALHAIRLRLQEASGRPHFDFYDEEIWAQWDPNKPVEPPEGEGEDEEELLARRVWIEKTHVQGREDRLSGDYALGKMLWSPQRNQGGGDIYHFMRDVQAGDLVLHLTDNEGFTGVSVAAKVFEEFNGLPNTNWNDRPSYKIQLQDFRELDPPLLRETFFASPYKEQLVALLDQGAQNLFYNREPSLNQGAYLTPAPAELVAVLEESYVALSGRSLLGSAVTPKTRAPPQPPLAPPREDLAAMVSAFSQALRAANLDFGPAHLQLVRAFIVSLATKRFVILTGLSGSGKSQIAIKFGQWLGREQYKVVAVRPDWTGPDALFGYEDALRKAKDGRQGWSVPESLEFMLKAARDPSRPYALILDEMNLAHVERYFADALSGIETSEGCLPNLERNNDGVWVQESGRESKLAFPENLFVIGTVNVDETTYLFSPKVLDRANTFEFRVDTASLSSMAKKPVSIDHGDPGLAGGFLRIARQEDWHIKNEATWTTAYTDHLRKLHELLSESSLEFGHRVFYEAVRFSALHEKAGEPSLDAALDRQLLQKILPRIHGSRKRVEGALRALGEFCMTLTYSIGGADPGKSSAFDVGSAKIEEARLPLSLSKVKRMMRTLQANQFTSFTD